MPEPFHLSTGGTTGYAKGADERTERARAEVEQKRMAECTFSPRTNEASVAQLLKAKAPAGYAR